MDRILQGTTATLTMTLTVDGTATDPSPDTAKVTVVHESGAVIVDDQAATNLGTGEFGYPLPPVATRGDLTATWTVTVAGNEVTVVTLAEIVTPRAQRIRDVLVSMCSTDTPPELVGNELWDLVRFARAVDPNGLYADDPGWEETYDVNAAAAEGWRRKAGKAVPLYSFGVDNQRSEQSHIHAHCLAQAEIYARKGFKSIRVSTESQERGDVCVN